MDFVNGSEDPYAIQVNAPRGYFQPVMLDNVVITKGRPIMATVALTPAPDLAIVNVDPACVRSGQTTIAIRVKNQGEASSSSTQGILASSSFAIPALEPRTAKTIRVTIIVGTSLVTAIVDSNNAVSESDETNNQITIMGCSTQ